ncbi:hypothetical protein LX36DRAFT_658256 [Colletotrichum falcatum]|nr:hypothetical protein LX36DRAFT_658256 [Colletotrichum falcatum]
MSDYRKYLRMAGPSYTTMCNSNGVTGSAAGGCGSCQGDKLTVLRARLVRVR